MTTPAQLPTAQSAYEVRRSTIHGNGVFASRDIEAGECIVEYEGERISADESAIRAEQGGGPINHTFFFSLADGRVEFAYKDYKDPARLHKTMKLSAHDFIQRFLFHVLPAGFHRIRYYGFLANGKRKQNLARIRELLVPPQVPQDAFVEPVKEMLFRCPLCAGEHFKASADVKDAQTISWMLNLLSWKVTQGGGL